MINPSTDKLVSVVIPCYNDDKYLGEAIVSVLNSTYKNIEIILINDGSTDKTKEIGVEFQDKFKNVKYYEQRNKGVSAARNLGVNHSSGEFILPLDADDKISSRYIELAAQCLEQNDQVKVVYSEAEFFGIKRGKWNLPEFDRNKLARENMIFNAGMYRKDDFLKCGGYAEEMAHGWEDWEFWISMLKGGGVVYKIPEICFYYRIKPAEKSRRKSMSKVNKRSAIDFINIKHSDFMIKQLNGRLHYMRSWSKMINAFYRSFGIGPK